MGCPTEVVIGDDLVFGITTHDPDTGELTDADAAPIWRLYENETGVPILTGTMAKLDDAGTTGFYTELIECTAGNGFNDRMTYSVYITAMVDGDTGGICYAFKAKAEVADLVYVPDASSVITTGVENANTWTACSTNNGIRWQIIDDGSGLDVTCEINMGAGRSASMVFINGYFDRAGGSAVVEVYAWNYSSADWDKLSAGTFNTEMRNRANDKNYVFSLNANHTDAVTTPGEVKIRFLATEARVNNELLLDYVPVTGIAVGGTTPPAVIADAVWSDSRGHDVSLHIPKYIGHTYYVNGTLGSDANTGLLVREALQTIGAALAVCSSGDRIVVFAGTYAEAGLDLGTGATKTGVELIGEVGVILTGGGGTCLEVSGDSCFANGIWGTPAAGQMGFDVGPSNATHRVRFFSCISYSSGSIGFRSGATSGQATFNECCAKGYSATGFELQGPAGRLSHCRAVAATGSMARGVYLSNAAANRCLVSDVVSDNNGLAAYETVVGADENVFYGCATSKTCGAIVDNGTNNAWRCMCDEDVPGTNITQIGGSTANATALLTLIAKFSGITSVTAWLRAMLRKDTADATALTEINLGGGTYEESKHSQEAIGDSVIAGGGGEGAISWEVLVDDGTNPIDGVEVWITTDEAGEHVVAGTRTTNAMGIVTFMLDAGDYFLWKQIAGVEFTNPEAMTVS